MPIKQFNNCRTSGALNYSHPGDERSVEDKMLNISIGETVEDYFINRFDDLKLNGNKHNKEDLHSYQYDLFDIQNNLRIEVKTYSSNTISFTMRNNKKWSPKPGTYHQRCLDLTHPINGSADIIIFCHYEMLNEFEIKITPTLIIDAELHILDKIGNKTLSHNTYTKNGKLYVGANWIGCNTNQVNTHNKEGEGIRKL